MAPKPKQVRWKRVGNECWYIAENARWYRCKIVARTSQKITIKPTTYSDSKREATWPHGEQITIGLYGMTGNRVRAPFENPT